MSWEKNKNFSLSTTNTLEVAPDSIGTTRRAQIIDDTRNTNEFYELEEGEVVDVILNEQHKEYKNPDDIGKVKIRKLHSDRDSNEDVLNWAKPADRNNFRPPVLYENVLVGEYINKNASGSSDSKESYYLSTFCVFGSVNHNAYPDVSLSKERLTKTEEQKSIINKYEETEIGNTSTEEDDFPREYTLGKTFIKDDSVHGLEPFEGDYLIQGRFGNSIRFGSTNKIIDSNSPLNWWSKLDNNGDSILIIRNGENDESKKKELGKTTLENIDKDYSSIYMTSTQYIPIKRAGIGNPTWGNKSQKELKNDDYKGKQIFINTDRIVLNCKERELLGFSKMNIGWSTEQNFTVDAKKLIHLNSPEIFLGLNSNSDGEPIVMGNKLVDLLSDLIAAILDLKYNYQFVPGTQIHLESVRNRLSDILSKKNYTQ